LYGAWSGGLLCLTLSEDNDPFGLPIAINSSLLAILAPNTFNDLIPEVQPLEIATEPRVAPTVGPPGGGHDLSIVDDELGLIDVHNDGHTDGVLDGLVCASARRARAHVHQWPTAMFCGACRGAHRRNEPSL
jgi:hypothetical protein